jgi:hypothetical protein
VLDVALALNRVADVFVELGQHKSLEAIAAREAVETAGLGRSVTDHV